LPTLPTPASSNYGKSCVIFLGFVIAARMLLSAALPVMEFSEARYAEIARQILVTGNWVTLWFNDGEPFWGKPPLAFWSIAVSYLVLGVNELTARLPSLLATIGTGAALFWWSRTLMTRSTAFNAVLCYASCVIVLQTAGSVITDPMLTLTTTLVMISFWQAVQMHQKRFAWLMWIALALGLLAKGPVALVLCGLPCGLWLLIYRPWRAFFSQTHLFFGVLLLVAVAAPWYYVAESRTPGFWDYFVVGEHFERYIQNEWTGDKYGAVKDRPYGTIWVFFLIASLPWSLVLFYGLCNAGLRRNLLQKYKQNQTLIVYLLCWTVAPLCFFTLSSSVLITYVLPCIPPFCLLVAAGMQRGHLTIAIIAVPAFFAISIGTFWVLYEDHRYNQWPIIEKYVELNQTDPGVLIYTGKHRFAPVFYTRGKVRFENTETRHGMPDSTFYIAVRDLWLDVQTKRLTPRCQPLMTRNEFTLFYCPAIWGDVP